jgi:hypothetical protein
VRPPGGTARLIPRQGFHINGEIIEDPFAPIAIADGDGDQTETVDMGAYEFIPAPEDVAGGTGSPTQRRRHGAHDDPMPLVFPLPQCNTCAQQDENGTRRLGNGDAQ